MSGGLFSQSAAPEAAERLLAALRGDFELQQLADGIALSDRFHFYILLCPTPALTNLALLVLREKVSEERAAAAELFRIDPYVFHADLSEAVPYELLVEQVLEKLVHPPSYSKNAIVIVDASRAVSKDEDAWRNFFGRLNERRNVIAARLPVPLVLALPTWMERLFALAAPDFWSVQSLTAKVQDTIAPRPPNAPKAEEVPLSEFPLPGFPLPGFPRDDERTSSPPLPAPFGGGGPLSPSASFPAQLLGPAPQPAPPLPPFRPTIAELETLEAEVADLRRRALTAEGARDLDEALRLARKRVATYDTLVNARPDRLDWKVDRATAQVDEGDFLTKAKNNRAAAASFAAARAALEEALSNERRVPWLARLGEAEEKLANAHWKVGEELQARIVVESAIQVRRDLLLLEPTNARHRTGLVRTLTLAGLILGERDPVSALDYLEEGVKEARSLVEATDTAGRRDLLSMVLLEAARAKQRLGHSREAVQSAEEAEHLAPTEAMAKSASAFVQRAQVATGDPDRARATSGKTATNVYLAYAYKDHAFAKELEAHLAPLVAMGRFRVWHRDYLRPGEVIETRIQYELDKADLIVPLLSGDFLASDESAKVLRRRQKTSNTEPTILPVLVRPCFLEGSVFADLAVLPTSYGSISRAPDRNSAWLEVVTALRRAADHEEITAPARAPPENPTLGLERMSRDALAFSDDHFDRDDFMAPAALAEVGQTLAHIAHSSRLRMETVTLPLGVDTGHLGDDDWLGLVQAIHAGVHPPMGEGRAAVTQLVQAVARELPQNAELQHLLRTL